MKVYKRVTVKSAPITERYWFGGCSGQVDEYNQQICVSGTWFPFDNRWEVEDVK